VYYRADNAHGGQTQHQWIEVFNGTDAAVDVSRWAILTTSTAQTLPANTSIPARGYLVLAGTTSVRTLWNIPTSTRVIPFQTFFAGFVAGGDHVYLQNTANTTVDAMSWGTDRSGFSPSAPTAQLGFSLIRKNLVTDTDTATDWVGTAAPNPGR
jgi:5'-nucleotidase